MAWEIGAFESTDVSGDASGTLADITVTTLDGSSAGDASTSGALSNVLVTTLDGSADTGTDASASGLLANVSITTLDGSAAGDSSATGALNNVLVTTLDGSASTDADGIASGLLANVSVTTLDGSASAPAGTPVSYAGYMESLSPISYWRFGEATGETVAVDEMLAVDGTYTGTCTLETDSLVLSDTNDKAVHILGSSVSYVTLDSTITHTGDWSISALINIDASADEDVIFTSHTSNRTMIFYKTGNIQLYNITSGWVDTGVSLDTERTYSIAITATTSSLLLYVDGVYEYEYITVDLSNLNATHIGKPYNTATTQNFNGIMDEFALFDKVLTPTEIANIHARVQSYAFDITIDSTKVDSALTDFPLLVNLGVDSGITTFDTTQVFNYINDNYPNTINVLNPISYWRLNDTSGPTAVDETSVNDGTYVSTPTYSETGLLINDTDDAVTFGPADYVTTTATTTAKAISFLFSVVDNSTAYQPIFGQYKDNSNRSQFHAVASSGDSWVGGIFVVISASVYIALTDDILYGNGTHHCVITYDGADTLMYIDNVLQTNKLVGNNFFMSDHTYQSIAAYTYNSGYISAGTRTIDEVALFDTHLTADDVNALYQSSLTSSNLDLITNTVVSSTALCKTEIEYWDSVNKTAQLWVKVPTVSSTVDTVINLSFDPANDSNSTNIGITGTTPAQAVWDDYSAVWHLSKDGTDSTASGFDGTLFDMDSSNVTDFAVGKGLSFDGLTEKIDGDDFLDLNLDDLHYSVTAYIGNTTNYRMLFSKGSTATTGRYYFTTFGTGIRFYLNSVEYSFLSTVAIGETHNFDIVVDRSGFLKLYVDGVLDGIQHDISAGENTTLSNADDFNIGVYGSTLYEFLGNQRHTTHSKIIPTADWIASKNEAIDDNLATFTPTLLTGEIAGSATGALAGILVTTLDGNASAGSVGEATGDLDNVLVSALDGSANGGVTAEATGLLSDVLVTNLDGSASAGSVGEATGLLSDVLVTTLDGSASATGSATGDLDDVLVSTLDGSANATSNGEATGLLDDISVSSISGSASGAQPGSAIGNLDDVLVTSIEGSANAGITGNATGTLSNVSITNLDGSAGASGTANGTLSDVNVINIDGSAFASADVSGLLSDVSVTPIDGSAKPVSYADGELSDTNVTPINGSSTGSAHATGLLDGVTVSPVDGFSGGASAGEATGALSSVSVNSLDGSAGVGSYAFGDLADCTISTLEGDASGEATISALLDNVTVSNIDGYGATGHLYKDDIRFEVLLNRSVRSKSYVTTNVRNEADITRTVGSDVYVTTNTRTEADIRRTSKKEVEL